MNAVSASVEHPGHRHRDAAGPPQPEDRHDGGHRVLGDDQAPGADRYARRAQRTGVAAGGLVEPRIGHLAQIGVEVGGRLAVTVGEAPAHQPLDQVGGVPHRALVLNQPHRVLDTLHVRRLRSGQPDVESLSMRVVISTLSSESAPRSSVEQCVGLHVLLVQLKDRRHDFAKPVVDSVSPHSGHELSSLSTYQPFFRRDDEGWRQFTSGAHRESRIRSFS